MGFANIQTKVAIVVQEVGEIFNCPVNQEDIENDVTGDQMLLTRTRFIYTGEGLTFELLQESYFLIYMKCYKTWKRWKGTKFAL